LAGNLSKRWAVLAMANNVLPAQSAPRAASGTLNVRILRSGADSQVAKDDRVAVEAPLEFLLHHPALGLEPMSFGTTMRTPGDDEWLAAGAALWRGDRESSRGYRRHRVKHAAAECGQCPPASHGADRAEHPLPALFSRFELRSVPVPRGSMPPSPAPPPRISRIPDTSLCRC